MRKILLASSLFASLALALPAVTFAANPTSTKASNINQGNTTSRVAPQLPTANLGASATVSQYLSVATSALEAGKTGLAQSSLENAETLALTRAVPYTTSTTSGNVRDTSPLVTNINSALQALGHHDMATAQHHTMLAQQEAGTGVAGHMTPATPMGTRMPPVTGHMTGAPPVTGHMTGTSNY